MQTLSLKPNDAHRLLCYNTEYQRIMWGNVYLQSKSSSKIIY